MTTKILIVDDEKRDLDFMESALVQAQYDVTTASNGAEALDRLTEKGFDLIIIDARMPTLSGADLLEMVRDQLGHTIKIIFATILSSKDVGIQQEIDGFIQKPFSKEGFVAEVQKVLL